MDMIVRDELDINAVFDKFPNNIQAVLGSHCCDPRSVSRGTLGTALWEDYEQTRDDVLPLCTNEPIKLQVLEYLLYVYP